MTSISGIAASASTMRLSVTLLCLSVATASLLEESNMRSRGVQTFGDATGVEDLPPERNATTVPVSITTAKPHAPSYTVVDWRRFYPFGGKINETYGEKKVMYPVYVKVPIRVPVKAGKRSPFAPRTLRGAYRPRQPQRPRTRSAPARRRYVAYHRPAGYLRSGRKYLGSKYHFTGIHDLHKMNAYYPLRGRGYEVTERTANHSVYWPPRNNLL